MAIVPVKAYTDGTTGVRGCLARRRMPFITGTELGGLAGRSKAPRLGRAGSTASRPLVCGGLAVPVLTRLQRALMSMLLPLHDRHLNSRPPTSG